MKEKGFSLIFLIIGLIVLAVTILLAPFPYYFNGWCDLPCYEENCCPSKGWHLGASLWKQFISKYSPMPEENTVNINIK